MKSNFMCTENVIFIFTTFMCYLLCVVMYKLKVFYKVKTFIRGLTIQPHLPMRDVD